MNRKGGSMRSDTPDILTDTPVLETAALSPTKKSMARPQAILNPTGVKVKKRKKNFNPDDPEDPDDTTEDPDDDDDDDGETGNPTDPDDGGDEDENELQQGEEKKQSNTVKQPPHLQQVKPLEKKKEIPQGPQKIERSPLQQMFDFLMHGVRGAQIKNGEIPLKPSLADSLLAGFGFKSYKKEILVQEQAQQFWLKKFLGRGEDVSLLNTDLADKKLKKQEEPSLKNIELTLSAEKEKVQIQETRKMQVFNEKIINAKREENRLQQEIGQKSTQSKSSAFSLKEPILTTVKSSTLLEAQAAAQRVLERETKQRQEIAQPSLEKATINTTSSVEKNATTHLKQAEKNQDTLTSQQQRMLEQSQLEAQQRASMQTMATQQALRPFPHFHDRPPMGMPPRPSFGNRPPLTGQEAAVSAKLVAMEGTEQAAAKQAAQTEQMVQVQAKQPQRPVPPQGHHPKNQPASGICAIPKGAENTDVGVLPSGNHNTLSEAGRRVDEEQQQNQQQNNNHRG